MIQCVFQDPPVAQEQAREDGGCGGGEEDGEEDDEDGLSEIQHFYGNRMTIARFKEEQQRDEQLHAGRVHLVDPRGIDELVGVLRVQPLEAGEAQCRDGGHAELVG